MRKVMPIPLIVLVLIGPRVSGSTSGTSLGACGSLRKPPRFIPPHSVEKPYTNSLPSSIVTIHFQTALHLAIARLPSSLAVVRLLLSRGADWSIGSDDEEAGTAREQIKGIIGCIRAGT